MSSSCSSFKQNAAVAIHDPKLQGALGKLGDGLQARRAAAVGQLPEFDALRNDAQRIKRQVMADLDCYLEQFESKVLEQGGQVHWASTADDARNAVLDICQKVGAKTVTKGKSMVTEELELNNFLADNGIEPVETDLGEYILQLRKEAPSHIVVPAVHLQQDDIAKTFVKSHAQLDPSRDLTEPERLVGEAREALRERFFAADVGITGANYMVAETGSTVIVTNEGNGDLTQTLPKVHVVVTTIERVIPTLEDLSTFLRLLPRSATGQEATAYVTLSSGPKREDDWHGPQEFHVVILDGGRSELLGSENQDVLNCIRCGACMNHCPVYGAVGGHAYGWVYPGPIGSALTPALIGVEKSSALPNASTFCGRCVEVCPVKIPLTDIMRRWRVEEQTKKLTSPFQRAGLSAWAWLATRPGLYQALTGLTAWGMKVVGRRRGGLTRLPFASGWTQYRNFPTPEGKTFHAQMKQKAKTKANLGVRYE
ncbi:lactate utilization protein [Gilvimarinus agarilyticus]|uniref:lactate utilization protein B n=1 Tax=Gilvimarinus sp. 2_MG-2023 TaxID=3062666 RepID=UPI001C0862D4|nr:lactate utilization protein B [Gilvimarinus sp. 2_MG-2023]MBU2885636.1 lactate utilization protein [Gilvimarinus agarilyticus]MDO6570498.1 lactate utilization protein B [Gilvimarinus sp. 2_MG-2023]